MAAIGAVACNFVRGDIPPLKVELDVWRIPGYAGYGAHATGAGDAAFRVSAVYFGNSAACAIWLAAIAALQGSVVTITTDVAAYSACLVTHVGPAQYTPAMHAGGLRAEVPIEGVRTA